ncbi:quinol monooxygenase YgiN [Bradyrhizobium sp. USDA 4518]
MIVQLLEVSIAERHFDRYLELAIALKPKLEAMPGCIFIDRFKSLSRKNVLLSYQIWRDDACRTARRAEDHHRVRTTDRKKIFAGYRVRVARMADDVGPGRQDWQAARQGMACGDPEGPMPRYAVVAEAIHPELSADVRELCESYQSVYRGGRFVHLADVRDEQAGRDLGQQLSEGSAIESSHIVKIIRDDGTIERDAAQP